MAPRGSSRYETQWGNFAPRVGVAVQLLRGGFGLFYDIDAVASVYAAQSDPFSKQILMPGASLPFATAQLSPAASLAR